MPPLRERREDIPLLAQHFLRVYAAKNNRRLEGSPTTPLRRLEAYAWPGNVRELENVDRARRACSPAGSLIDVGDLPEESRAQRRCPRACSTVRIGTPLAEIEQRLLDETLRVTRGTRRWPRSSLASMCALSRESSNAREDDQLSAEAA